MTMHAYFGLMIAVSAIWTLWFVYRPLKANKVNLEGSNIALGKQKQSELGQDLERGLIDKCEFDKAKEEITQILALELSQADGGLSTSSKQNIPYWIIILVLISLPVISLVTYNYLAPKHDVEKIDRYSSQQSQSAPSSLEQSIASIVQRLADNPDDSETWRVLGFAYFEFGNLEGSLNAYEQAYKLSPENPELLVEYASAIISANDNKFVPQAVVLIKQALEINPDAAGALYLSGMLAVSMKDFDLAKGLWRRALASLPDSSPDRKALENILAELDVITNTAPTSSASIAVSVDISEQVRNSRSKDDYLMVYAKAAKGTHMPIAIQKVRLKDFSGKIVLTDVNSVMSSNELSQAGDVIIVARISSSGLAKKENNDIDTSSQIIKSSKISKINLYLK